MSDYGPGWVQFLAVMGGIFILILTLGGIVLYLNVGVRGLEWINTETVKDLCDFLIKHRDEMNVNDFAGNFTRLRCTR